MIPVTPKIVAVVTKIPAGVTKITNGGTGTILGITFAGGGITKPLAGITPALPSAPLGMNWFNAVQNGFTPINAGNKKVCIPAVAARRESAQNVSPR